MTLEGEEIILRDADVRECWAGGFSPEEALQQSIEGSDYVALGRIDGVIAAVWGYRVDSVLSGEISAWLLSTAQADAFPLAFARQSLRELHALPYRNITVNVHEDYAKAIRWLKWLGFRPTGGAGAFIQMERTKWDS